MHHTFVVSGGIRVEIQTSKTEAGSVLLSILHSSGDRFGCATISASTAAVIAQALEIEAEAAERVHGASCAGDCAVQEVGGECKESCWRDAYALQGKVYPGRGNFPLPSGVPVRAYGYDNIAPGMCALPVVDVAQVGA